MELEQPNLNGRYQIVDDVHVQSDHTKWAELRTVMNAHLKPGKAILVKVSDRKEALQIQTAAHSSSAFARIVLPEGYTVYTHFEPEALTVTIGLRQKQQ